MTYIFEDIEIKTTGRTAAKITNKRQSRRKPNSTPDQSTKVLHEITPVDSSVGSWKKWVDLSELFIVEEEE